MLFVNDGQHGIAWLKQPADLFGSAATHVGKVTWYSGPSCVKQTELFSELQRTAVSYRSVETLPHEPMVAGHYYACDDIAPGDGTKLRELLGYFNPATAIDQDLLLAALANH
jgi:hypothetical protein